MEFLHILSRIRIPFLDGLFQLITYFGQAVPLLLLLCAIYWCVNKELAYGMGLSFFTSGLMLQTLKITFRIPRPWVLDPEFSPVESAVSGATGYSFPSGHTQSAAAFWGYLCCSTRKRSTAFLYVLIFLAVGFSRMYLGCHTPKDVLAGMALGLLSVFPVRFFMTRFPRWIRKANGILSIVLFLASLVSAIYGFRLLSTGIISPENAKDCITAAGAGMGFSLGWYLEREYICFSVVSSAREGLLRYFPGILLLLILKIALGALSKGNLYLKMLEYFLIVLFITAGYPAWFSRKKR